MSSPLQSPRLRRIIAAYTINRLGTWFGLVALSLAVFENTHSALAVAALFFAGQALPAFAVPALVARVEASRRRGELSGLYLFEAVVTAALAILLWNFSLPAVLVLVALDGTAALAVSALLRAEVARVARAHAQAGRAQTDEQRAHADDETLAKSLPEATLQEAERKANAALNVAFSATFVLGPVLGGLVVAAASASAALFIDVGAFLICAALLIDLHPHVEEASGDSVRSRLRAAWRHISEAPTLRGLLLADAVALVFFQAQGPIGVPYAKVTLHAGDGGYGLLITMWGAGVVVGALVFARSLRYSLTGLVSAATLAIGLAFLGFAVAPSLPAACVAAVVGGVGNGMELPSMVSLVQQLSPAKLHGRMMAALESLASIALAVGLPLGGALVALGSPRLAFVVLGVGAMASAGALFRISRKGPAVHRDEHAAATESPAA